MRIEAISTNPMTHKEIIMAARKSTRTAGTIASTDASTDLLARVEGESDVEYVTRMVEAGTPESIEAGKNAFLVVEDVERLRTFEGRVERCVMIGRLVVADVTLREGAVPEDFDAIAKSIEVTSKGGEYLGYKYAKLSEAYRIARDHTVEAMTDFVAAYKDATGKNPEQVRHYVKYAYAAKNPDSKRAESVVEDLSKRIESEASDAIKAAERAAERAALVVLLARAGMVEGVPMSKDEWSSLTEDQAKSVASTGRSHRQEAWQEAP